MFVESWTKGSRKRTAHGFVPFMATADRRTENAHAPDIEAQAAPDRSTAPDGSNGFDKIIAAAGTAFVALTAVLRHVLGKEQARKLQPFLIFGLILAVAVVAINWWKIDRRGTPVTLFNKVTSAKEMVDKGTCQRAPPYGQSATFRAPQSSITTPTRAPLSRAIRSTHSRGVGIVSFVDIRKAVGTSQSRTCA